MTKKQKLSIAILVVFSVIGLGIYKFIDSIPKYKIVNLKFDDRREVSFYYEENSIINNFSWMLQEVEDIPFNLEDMEDVLDSVYTREDGPPVAIFNSTLEKYYILEPGGYETLSIVDGSIIEELGEYEDEVENKKEGAIHSTKCDRGIIKDFEGTSGWKFVTCISEVYDKKEKTTSDFGYTKTCYLPLESGLYLEFDTPVKSAGSEVDNCELIYSEGIRQVKLAR